MKTESSIKLEAADGHKIPAKLLVADKHRLVILTHGITTNMDEDGTYTRFAADFLAPDFSSLRFDFRGHGKSMIRPRETTIAGELLDLMAAFHWSRQQGFEEILHLATSFGAGITLLAARRFDLTFLKRVALWNPVIDYDHTFINAITPWGKEFFNQLTVDELADRKGTPIPETTFTIGPQMTMELLLLRPQDTPWPQSVPLMAIHGTEDSLVPWQDAEAYCKRNRSAATFVPIEGVDHGFDDRLESVFAMTVAFLESGSLP